MTWLCLLLGHVPRVRFFINSRMRFPSHRKPGLCAVAVCELCGKHVSPPANTPRRH